MASQRQKEKKAAAQGYDYEQDGRWAEYWSNVLVPAHLAGRPEVLQHFKLKFYQRHIVRFIVSKAFWLGILSKSPTPQ
ncbi:hypothetical protein O6H91_Y150900 [Diphasiastrum complanatum]|nr:hypothetical protein O6H91_Y150900 [Diphasiastrum complanatum]